MDALDQTNRDTPIETEGSASGAAPPVLPAPAPEVESPTTTRVRQPQVEVSSASLRRHRLDYLVVSLDGAYRPRPSFVHLGNTHVNQGPVILKFPDKSGQAVLRTYGSLDIGIVKKSESDIDVVADNTSSLGRGIGIGILRW